MKKKGVKKKSFRAIWKSEKWGKKKVGVEKKITNWKEKGTNIEKLGVKKVGVKKWG